MRTASASVVSRTATRRTLLTGGLLGALALVLPLALAWACVPGATIGFDRAVYEYRAGDTVTVLGRAFAPATQVTLTLAAPSGASTTVGSGVLTDSAGTFRDSFALPASAAPGAYVVVASINTTDVDGHGRAYEARESFTVPPPVDTAAAPAQPPVLAPVLGTGLTDFKTSLTLKARLMRGGGRRFRYRFRGRVDIPAGVSRAAVCGGSVKLSVRSAGRVVVKGIAKVSPSCTYERQLTVRNVGRSAMSHKLKVVATFGGNAQLGHSRKSATLRPF